MLNQTVTSVLISLSVRVNLRNWLCLVIEFKLLNHTSNKPFHLLWWKKYYIFACTHSKRLRIHIAKSIWRKNFIILTVAVSKGTDLQVVKFWKSGQILANILTENEPIRTRNQCQSWALFDKIVFSTLPYSFPFLLCTYKKRQSIIWQYGTWKETLTTLRDEGNEQQ